MNKIIAIALSVAAVIVWTGIAQADVVCSTRYVLGGKVVTCQTVHASPKVREPVSFAFGSKAGGK